MPDEEIETLTVICALRVRVHVHHTPLCVDVHPTSCNKQFERLTRSPYLHVLDKLTLISSNEAGGVLRPHEFLVQELWHLFPCFIQDVRDVTIDPLHHGVDEEAMTELSVVSVMKEVGDGFVDTLAGAIHLHLPRWNHRATAHVTETVSSI